MASRSRSLRRPALSLLHSAAKKLGGGTADLLPRQPPPPCLRSPQEWGLLQFHCGRSAPRHGAHSLGASRMLSQGNLGFFVQQSREYMITSLKSNTVSISKGRQSTVSYPVRAFTSKASSESSKQSTQEETRKDIATSEDPFDAPTYNIPEKPVTFTEGAIHSVVILAGLGIAAAAAYAVFKELIFEPKEYKIFGKALKRVQNDSQVKVRIGSPVTGYGQESMNRAARQRIPNRIWTDEDGIEHVEVNFHIRGPHGAGKVYSEMFRDNSDRQWKFTYLIVEIASPQRAQLMLESYVPA